MSHNDLDRPGIGKPAADDKHECDDDRGRMTKTGERLLDRHETRQQGRKERNEGNKVITPASPDQERENEQQQRKQRQLIGRQDGPHCKRYGRGVKALYL